MRLYAWIMDHFVTPDPALVEQARELLAQSFHTN